MKLTESQLKTIILEEAAKVKKAISLKKQLQEVQQQLDEVMGGPHGGGKKTFKKAEGGFKETQGALVEDDMTENFGTPSGAPAPAAAPSAPGQEETFDFSEEELEEMLNMGAEGGSGIGEEECSTPGMAMEGTEEEEVVSEDVDDPFTIKTPAKDNQFGIKEAGKTSAPFTEDAPKEFNMKESVELLRMKKLAGLI